MLIKNLPRDSAFQIAASGFDWPLEAHLAAGAWNEIQAMRGDLWALIGHERMSFKPVLPPSAERAQTEKRSQIRAAHDEVMAQLHGRTQD